MNEWGEEPAFEMVEGWIDGWDCTVVFDEEVVGALEGETLDRLCDNLAASDGITEVLHEDREVLHLKADVNLSSIEGKVAEAIEQTGIGYGGHSP